MPPRSTRSAAFLLSQVGAHSAARFAELTAREGITPSAAGVLRALGRHPHISQRELADLVGTVPSRIVVLVDELERAELVARSRSTIDRRNYRLDLTDQGRGMLQRLRAVATEHEHEILAPLGDDQRRELAALLQALADGLGLGGESHPGYRGSRAPD